MLSPCLLIFLLASCSAQKADIDKKIEVLFGTPDNPIMETSSTSPLVASSSTTEPSEEINLNPAADSSTCTMPNGTIGVCAVYYQCDSETRKLITDGSTLIDIRVRDRPCPGYFDVCCLEEQVNATKPTPPPPPPPSKLKCGYGNAGADTFRLQNDGTLAEFGEFPWMVAIMKKTNTGSAWTKSNYLGGGSIIHPSAVLTAAHKVDSIDASDIKVRAGEWDTQTEDEQYPFQERNIRKVIMHEDFEKKTILNSVAVLFLTEPFIFEGAPHMGVACIGHALPPPDTRCFSMGWGAEDFKKKGEYAVVLKKVELPLVTRGNCRDRLRKTRLGSYFLLHSSYMCAGGEKGKDTCKGDGGAPLVCHIGEKKDNRFAQYGAVAWGIGCGEDGVPAIYVNMARFREWIADVFREEQLDPSSFEYE